MISIISAAVQHIEEIRKIAFKTWPITFGKILSEAQIEYMLNMMYSQEALTRQIEEQKHCFLLGVENGRYLGYVSYELHYQDEAITKIHKIYVLPEAQGKGVGKVLLSRVEAEAILHGDQKLALNVNKYNEAAYFYNRMGFECVGTEDIDIGSGFLMEDKIMEKKLATLE